MVALCLLAALESEFLLRGSRDLVTRVIIKVTTLITPLRVLITLLTKSHDPPSRVQAVGADLTVHYTKD